MFPSLLTRRAAVAALGGAFAAVAGAAAAAPRAGTFRAITIDVAPLAARGSRQVAELVRRELARVLPQEFAGRITGASGAPTLVVRVTSLSLAGWAGGGGVRGRGTFDTDYLEGEALIVPAAGRAGTARVPILSAVPASSSGAWYLPDIEERRIAYIAAHFAGWLARKV